MTEISKTSQNRISNIALWIAGVCTVVAACVLFDLIPLLRGGFGWQWSYALPPFARAGLFAAIILVYGIGAWRLRGRDDFVPLAWAFSGVILLTVCAVWVRADDVLYELFARTASPLATGVHSLATRIDWASREWLNWAAIMPLYEGEIAHVTLAPPALPMLYGGLSAILESVPALARLLQNALLPYGCDNFTFLAYTPGEWGAITLGMLMPIWAALSVFPLRAVGRRVLDREGARWALLIFPLMPALLAFAGSWNTIYPLMSLTAFWALERGLNAKRRALWLCLSGIITGVCIFVNFAFVPLVLLFGVYTLLRWFWRERSARNSFIQPVRAGIAFGVGLGLPWIVYYGFTGSTAWDLLATSMGMHLALEREYLPWLALHLWDWLLWTGLPFAGFALAGMILYAARKGWRADAHPPVLPIALGITMAILLLSAFARGETGRVWLLFAPFLLLAAVDGVKRLGAMPGTYRLVLVAQGVWTFAVIAALPAMTTELTAPPPAPPMQSVQNALDADFGGQFRLLGWEGAQTGDAITLTLNWEAQTQMNTPYWIAALLVDGAGNPAGETQVWQPFATTYPTTCWQPEVVLSETITFPLPENAAPGEWWISLAVLEDTVMAERLSVTTADGVSDQVGIGGIPVQASP